VSYLISGIQQIGIGIPNLETAWHWYRCLFGMDILIFREAAEALHMTPYTGGTVQSRDAILAANLRGGAGFEIWQYTSRKTLFPDQTPVLGDIGIYAARIKAADINAAHHFFVKSGAAVQNNPTPGPDGQLSFFVRDPWDNLFQIVPSDEWFQKKGHPTGGTVGALIGVSNIDKSFSLYSEHLGYDIIDYDEEGHFADWSNLNDGATDGTQGSFRRMLLSRGATPAGPFSLLSGSSKIELVQALDRSPQKIFNNRYWGDGGFIHLCFEIEGMDHLGEQLSSHGFPFTVDSQSSFDMGQAGGRFAYIEDPDGTLIEFVETKKIPLMGKWGWYINLAKRPQGKPLSRFILKALALNRVKGGCDSFH